MKRLLTAGILASTVVCMDPANPLHAAPPAAAPATTQPANPATAQAQIPVKQVALFSSGVGYFEHYGTVTGSGNTELRFKSAQINDILKSLVLQDLDKGRVSTITYPSQDPIAKTLRSFQIDITGNPSLNELLNQLRGARVKVTASGQDISGTVLGVEKKQLPLGEAGKQKAVDVWVLNLITGASIRPVPLDEVRNLTLEDAELQEELTKALAALAQARDQDKKPITINFNGEGERRIRVGYVVETPVWKTSYRLVFNNDAAGAGNAGPATNPATKPATQGQAGAGVAVAGTGGKLQGWAIVENQTDNDWNDVQLSLISGRPISFIQDLYQPLYVPRPVVQPELYASLRPQTYEGGMQADKQMARFGTPAAGGVGGVGGPLPPPGVPPMAAAKPGSSVMNRAEQLRKSSRGGRALGEADGAEAESLALMADAPMDASASIASVASAAKVGELFQYTVGSVSLPRQRSAMIPIIADDLEVERISIYNPSVLPRNPLYGARVKNSTTKHLLAGPITVLDGGAYAGDASIENLPPGQERLISYGVDLQVLVDATKNKQESAVQTGKIVKGVLTVTRKLVFSQDYAADNKGDKDKTLIIEHPRRGGGWKLTEPAKAEETTDALYRFKGSVAAGKATKLTVKEEVITGEQIAIAPTDRGALEIYQRTAEIPQAVRDVLAKAITAKYAMFDTERQIAQKQQELGQITQEQNRIRENMKTVAQNSEYYGRLVKKLNDQETLIEKHQTDVTALQQTLETQRKALEDYLANTTVDEKAPSAK